MIQYPTIKGPIFPFLISLQNYIHIDQLHSYKYIINNLKK